MQKIHDAHKKVALCHDSMESFKEEQKRALVSSVGKDRILSFNRAKMKRVTLRKELIFAGEL